MNECIFHGHPLGVFTGSPIGADDPILVPGSLVLTDFPRSWPSSTPPVNLSSIYNLAWKEAAALVGSGTESTLASSLSVTAQPDEVILQMSGKGAIHGISSQINQEGTDRIYIDTSSIIRQYMLDHWTDEYYISIWTQTTRQALVITPDPFQMAANNNPGANYKMRFGEGANLPAVNGTGPVLSGGVQALGPQFRNNWRATQTGSTPADLADTVCRFVWGSQAATWQNKAASRILQRFYVESLTASGRTGAVVAAIDQALYTAQVMTVGGKFYNDTYNDPATVLP